MKLTLWLIALGMGYFFSLYTINLKALNVWMYGTSPLLIVFVLLLAWITTRLFLQF